MGNAELQEMLNELDYRDCLIDFQEFLALMARRITDEEDELFEVFKVYDRDAEGMINIAEARHVLSNIGWGLSDLEINEILNEVGNCDGQIDYGELVRLMSAK